MDRTERRTDFDELHGVADYDALAHDVVGHMSPLWLPDLPPLIAAALRHAHAAGRAEIEAERDAARDAYHHRNVEALNAVAERDRLAARVARLEAALMALCGTLPNGHAPSTMRLVRAALADAPAGGEDAPLAADQWRCPRCKRVWDAKAGTLCPCGGEDAR